nr:CRISPR-associated protein Csx19 [Kineosporia babensis]
MARPAGQNLTSHLLRAVESQELCTVAEALAWCWPDPVTSDAVVGFSYATDQALWWRYTTDGPHTAQGLLSLDDAYEVVAFDGVCELRWLQEHHGRGRAVVLGEEPDHLPRGPQLTGCERSREYEPLGDRHHLLAGLPVPTAPGWTRLQARRQRYRSADIPIDWSSASAPPAGIALRSREYISEDEYGNVSVTETRLISLLFLSEEAMLLGDPPWDPTNHAEGER